VHARREIGIGTLVRTIRALGAIALIAGLTTRALASQEPDASSRAADRVAIHTFWSTLDRTWAARDADRFAEFFTNDASFGFVDRGQSLETRAAIHRHFTAQFERQRPELRHVTSVRELRLIAPDVISMDGEVEVVAGHPEAAAPLRRLAVTAVMVRHSSVWRIRLLRAYQLPLPQGADSVRRRSDVP
jgi:uncharacterized protein (TIGR02246 family)